MGRRKSEISSGRFLALVPESAGQASRLRSGKSKPHRNIVSGLVGKDKGGNRKCKNCICPINTRDAEQDCNSEQSRCHNSLVSENVWAYMSCEAERRCAIGNLVNGC